MKRGEEIADVAQSGGVLGVLAGPGVEKEVQWTSGSNEFIQGGVGARGKSATLFEQDFANTESMLLKHLSVWERKREICKMSSVGAMGHF